MKKALVTILLFFPIVTLAQQNMMGQMQEMMVCMQSIDQQEVKALENDSKLFKAEVEGLCKEGKHDEAQVKAVEFSKKMMSSSILKTMRKCAEKMPASMQGMMPNMEPEEISKDYSKHHICDEI